ncbi:MAG TPA: hypothetical protein VF624_17170 [Tepidisphaeraceae bacterium]|jgi:hypothetical protein
MQSTSQPGKIKNHYEPRSTMRTITGVASSILFMGIPVGLTELIRPGGDTFVGVMGMVATVLAVVLAVFSIRGTLDE